MWLLPYFNGYWFIRLDSFGHSEDNSGRMTRGQVFVTPQESLTKIPYQNALEFLAFGKDLIGDRLRLEFLE